MNDNPTNAAEQCALGIQYLNGNGVPQDTEKTIYWFTKSAEQGHAGAQSLLGAIYETGKGVPQTPEKAVYWYTKAAEQGDAKAQSLLAAVYETGKGADVPQDAEKALYWYTKAAEQGNAKAQKKCKIIEIAALSEKIIAYVKKTAAQAENNMAWRLTSESSGNHDSEKFVESTFRCMAMEDYIQDYQSRRVKRRESAT